MKLYEPFKKNIINARSYYAMPLFYLFFIFSDTGQFDGVNNKS